MNSKGFTLIELIAVTMVLALIFLVSLPNILNITKSEEIKQSQFNKDALCIAGEAYIHSYPDSYPLTSGESFEISVEYLIDNGSIDDTIYKDLVSKSIRYEVLADGTLQCGSIVGG